MQHYIKLKLFATLADEFPIKSGRIKINAGTTVKTLVLDLGLNPKKIKLIFINGVMKQINSELNNGDRVGLFPPIGGG